MDWKGGVFLEGKKKNKLDVWTSCVGMLKPLRTVRLKYTFHFLLQPNPRADHASTTAGSTRMERASSPTASTSALASTGQ